VLDTYPLDSPIIFSLIGFCLSAKLATRNQDVCLLSFGPYEVPTTYLMTSPPLLVVVISGSVPRRPTRVRRASWDGRVTVNARVKAEDVERGARAVLRSGESRKDILGVADAEGAGGAAFHVEV
jgi:hypothetical protein